MAELKRICLEDFCSDVPEYTAGENIIIAGDNRKIISADLSDYYTIDDVNNIISAIEVGGYEEVSELPTEGRKNIIYLVPNVGGGYERWIWTDSGWKDLGDTDTVYTAGDNIEIAGINNAISVKDSPAFTGTPTAPTNSNASDSSLQLATDEFVQNALLRRLPKTLFWGTVASFSCPSNSEQFKDIWTAPSNGIAIISVTGGFKANATGYRSIWQCVRTSSGDTPVRLGNGMVWGGQGNSGQTFNAVTLYPITKNFILTLRYIQNSGNALNTEDTQWSVYFIPD